MTRSPVPTPPDLAPDQWPGDAPLRLEKAVAVFGQELPITVAMLRTEIRKGRLLPAKVAGKFFVTPNQLRALFIPCPAPAKAHASISEPIGSTRRPAALSRLLRHQRRSDSTQHRLRS